MVTERRADLMGDLAALVQMVETQPSADFDTVLDELTAGSVEQMPGADWAGISVVRDRRTVQTVAATGRFPGLLDKIQQRHREGPCVTAAWEQHMIRVDDIAQEQRWPNYCREAVEETPIRSVVAFQLFAIGQAAGALNFYSEQPHGFDDEAVELGFALATHTALAWHMVRRDEQFRSALASRDTIGQAKGMIMERFDIGAVPAFELLKRLSQESNTPLIDVAHQLVDRGGPVGDPGQPAAPSP